MLPKWMQDTTESKGSLPEWMTGIDLAPSKPVGLPNWMRGLDLTPEPAYLMHTESVDGTVRTWTTYTREGAQASLAGAFRDRSIVKAYMVPVVSA